MLDFLNVHLGGNNDGNLKDAGKEVGSGVKRTSLPSPGVSPDAQFAKKVAKVFDTTTPFTPEVAYQLWENTNDGQKMQIFEFLNVVFDQACARFDAGTYFTRSETMIANMAAELREKMTDE